MSLVKGPDRMRAICMRIEKEPHIESTQLGCETCQAKVWASPATLNSIKKYNAKVICVECFVESGPPNETQIEMTEEQALELELMFAENKA